MNRRFPLPLLLIPFFASTTTAQQSQVDPVDTITIAELRDHIYWLASDDLEGRYTGSKGYEIAAEYCASQFAAAGLKTVITDADGNPTYLQTVPIATRSVRSAPVMTVKASTSSQMVYAAESSDMFIPTIIGIKPGMAEAMFAGQAYSPVGPDAGDLDTYHTFDLEGVEVRMKLEVHDETISRSSITWRLRSGTWRDRSGRKQFLPSIHNW